MEETNKMNEETEKVEHQDVNQQENVTPESVQEVIEEATTAEPTSTEPIVETPQETSVETPAETVEENISDDMFDHCSKEELVSEFEKLLQEPDITKIKRQVSLLRSRFLMLLKEEKDQAKKAFIDNGGNVEEYTFEPDETDKKFDDVFGRYKAAKAKQEEDKEKEKLENLAKKQALLDELKVLVDADESLKQIYDHFNEVQAKWKEIGAVPQASVNDLWQTYHFYVEKFFNKVKINRELRNLDLKKNLERKIELCEKAEDLLLEDSVSKAFKLLQQYHQEWKETGAVEEEKKDELWNRFKAASDQINQKHKEQYTQMLKEQEENYQAKLALCDQLDELLSKDYKSSVKVLTETTDKVNELFKAWKTLGPAPKSVHEEVWDRFHKKMNVFFEDRKEFFKKAKENYANNINMKINICMRAEAIAIRTDWRQATKEIQELQQEWKTIGNIPRKQSEELWLRFRKACDEFFAAKEAHYTENVANMTENLAKKEALIQEVKDYALANQQDADLEAMQEFQRRWTEIGATTSETRNQLWNDFQTAIKQKFAEIKGNVAEEKKETFESRVEKCIEDMQDASKEKQAAKKLKGMQEQLQQRINELSEEIRLWDNNLISFAKSKSAETLKKQLEEKNAQKQQEIDKLKEKLSLIEKKKKELLNKK
ncbi:MAG: DUF349 domain-containing protein [Bacteroidales bacterium]|nr:DUF349 domain-containing protein [Bacteroidales bacterium]